MENQDPRANDCRNVGAVVGMFPADPAILFVETDTVLHLQGLALGIRDPSVKVLLSVRTKDEIQYLDNSETVTAQLEVIGSDPSTDISEIESRLAMIRCPRIRIWDKHVGQG